MSDNKPTPGSWEWGETEDEVCLVDGGGRCILLVRREDMPNRHDAALIAAAPDLLAACEALVLAMVGTLDEKQKAINQAGAAIKKAKGE